MGVYMISNTTKDKHYIGSTNNMSHRFMHHRNTLKNKCHMCNEIQVDYNKSDVLLFKIIKIIKCSERLAEEEYAYIQKFIGDSNKLYNKNLLTRKTNKSYSLDKRNIKAIQTIAEEKGIKDSAVLNDILNHVFGH